MKKIFMAIALCLVCAVSFISCGDKNAINKKDLIGVYDVGVNVSGLNDEESNPLASAFANMFLSMIKGTIEFQKDVMVSNIMGEVDTAEYKICNDSVLFVKVDNEYTEKGVIRKIGDSYNTLQLVSSDGSPILVLTKRKE